MQTSALSVSHSSKKMLTLAVTDAGSDPDTPGGDVERVNTQDWTSTEEPGLSLSSVFTSGLQS